MEEDRLIRDEEKVEPVEIFCVVDRSGSMHSLVDDAIGGFNAMIEEQKKIPGEAYLTLATFDDKYDLVYECKPLQEVPEANLMTFQPRGSTALWDAVGKTLEAASKRIGSERVIVVIITDGYENASSEYTADQVKGIVKDCKDSSWEFLFLGANIDSFEVGGAMGFAANQTFDYDSSGRGVQTMYSNVSDTVGAFRNQR